MMTTIKEMMWINETAQLVIDIEQEDDEVLDAIKEIHATGARITEVTRNHVHGAMACTLEKALELIDNGWEWS